jgi:hypothetical protein
MYLSKARHFSPIRQKGSDTVNQFSLDFEGVDS